MANVNKVILIGNITREPERRVAGNATLVEFGLAVNRNWKDGNGNKQEEVTFVDIVAWKNLGDIIHQYCRKGSPIYIEGRLKFDQWTAPDGAKRSKLSVVAESMQLLGGKDRESGPAGDAQREFGSPSDYGNDPPF